MLISLQELFNALYGSEKILRVSAIAGYTHRNIATSAQTTVKSSPGILFGVMINSSPTSAIRLYDNIVSGGTVIATFPASVAAGTFYGPMPSKLVSGLVVSTGSADTNITILYE